MSGLTAVRRHARIRWREAAIDGCLLGLFMVSVGVFAALLYSPRSPLFDAFPSELMRSAVMGMAMAATAAALIYSPWGGRSGAHMNPAVTLAFWRLGKIRGRDASAYVLGQCCIGVAATALIGRIIGPSFADPPVSYAPTVPGRWGAAAAFGAEVGMTFLMMLAVLLISNSRGLARYTGLVAAGLLFTYITFETPISGMSINPARTLSSAVPSGVYASLWVYLAAPCLGMLLAAELFARWKQMPAVHCCKLNHQRRLLCPFCGCDGPIDFDAHRNDPR